MYLYTGYFAAITNFLSPTALPETETTIWIEGTQQSCCLNTEVVVETAE
jgi:hypothetical protein